MGQENRKKNNKKKKASAGFTERLKKGWLSYLPVLLFVGSFVVIIGMFYAVWFSNYFSEHMNPRIAGFNAFFASKILNLFGQVTTNNGGIIYSSAYSISVAKGCDGIEAIAIFSSALLAFPLVWRKKIQGIVIGILLLVALNLVRIVSLFFIGKYYPSVFETFHAELWPVFFILAAVSLWGAWIFRSTKKVVQVPVENNVL